jgi:hypothetical protein
MALPGLELPSSVDDGSADGLGDPATFLVVTIWLDI